MTDTNIPDFNLVTPGLQLGATAKALTGAERKLIRGSDLALTMMWKNLVVGDDNIRDAAATDIEGLADSIRRVGLIEPIVVEQHSKDKWLVAAGHRRYLALQHLGLAGDDLVPVHTLEKAEGNERTTRMLAENVHRQNLNVIEEAQLIKRLVEWYGMTQQQVSDHLNANNGTVNARLNLLLISASVQAAIIDGRCDLEVGQKLGRYIKDGGSQATVDRMQALAIKGELNIQEVNRETKRLKASNKAAKLTQKLEASGLAVVCELESLEVEPGYELLAGDLFNQDDDGNHVVGLRHSADKMLWLDGKQAVLVYSLWDGDAVAFEVVKVALKPDAVTETGSLVPDLSQIEYESRTMVEAAIENKRLAWWKEATFTAMETLRMSTAYMIDWLPDRGLARLCELTGTALVFHHPGAEGMNPRDIDFYATRDALLSGANQATLEKLQLAVMTLDCGTIDNIENPAMPFHTPHFILDGMAGPVSAHSYSLLMAQATGRITAKHEAASAEEE